MYSPLKVFGSDIVSVYEVNEAEVTVLTCFEVINWTETATWSEREVREISASLRV